MVEAAYSSTGGEDVRPFPNAVEVERQVLGVMLLSKEAISQAASRLSTKSFYHSAHREIYEAVINLYRDDEGVDAVTLIERLRATDRLERARGEDYIRKLVSQIATTANIEDHINIVQRHAIRREMITLSDRLSRQSFDEASDVSDTISQAQEDLFSLAEKGLKKGFVHIESALHDTFEDLDRLYKDGEAVPGIRTGYPELDELTTGFQKGDLIIIAGRPSMGKTSFALNIAENVAVQSRIPVGIFSLEMSARQLTQRLLCANARVDSHAVRLGKLRDDEWARLCGAVGGLGEAPIYIDDSPMLTPVEARAKARRLKSEFGVELLIVDYMQLMNVPHAAENRQLEIATISRSLKALAKEVDVPVIALSQLSRAIEQRGGDHRPRLSDLRESGAIEQDADIVAFVHRPERFETDPALQEELKGKAELIIEKQRNGPTGTVQLEWVEKFARFENPSFGWNAEMESGPASEPAPAPVQEDDYEF